MQYGSCMHIVRYPISRTLAYLSPFYPFQSVCTLQSKVGSLHSRQLDAFYSFSHPVYWLGCFHFHLRSIDGRNITFLFLFLITSLCGKLVPPCILSCNFFVVNALIAFFFSSVFYVVSSIERVFQLIYPLICIALYINIFKHNFSICMLSGLCMCPHIQCLYLCEGVYIYMPLRCYLRLLILNAFWLLVRQV